MASKRELLRQKQKEKKVTIEPNTVSIIDSIIEKNEEEIAEKEKTNPDNGASLPDENTDKHNKILYADAKEFVPYYDKKLRLDIHTGEEYERLKESIEKNGIMQPIICGMYNGEKMIISGHNRVAIAKELNIKVPYILHENLSKEDMDLICIDTNLLNRQLTEYKVSQLAYVLKVKMDSEKHQGLSTGFTNSGTKIGEEYGLSRQMIHRYIKMNDLVPDGLELVDKKEISIKVAYELSFLKPEIQKFIIESRFQFKLSEKTLKILREELKEKDFNDNELEITYIKSRLFELCVSERQSHKIDYRNIKPYIPEEVKGNEIEAYVIEALKYYNTKSL